MEVRYFKYYKKKRLKYNNQTCICRQNHRHDSIAEGRYCDQLELLKKAGDIKDSELQVTFDLKVNGYKICGHRVDFLVTTNYGEKEVHEWKGFSTQIWNLKRKLFEAIYPDIKYITIRK